MELSPEFTQIVRSTIEQAVRDEAGAEHIRRGQLRDRLVAIQAKEDNLLDLAADGSLPQERIRQRLREIGTERETLREQLSIATADLATGKRHIETFLDLLTDVRALHLASSDQIRRELKQAVFNNLYIAHDQVIGDDVKEPLDEILAAHRGWTSLTASTGRDRSRQRETAENGGLSEVNTVGLCEAIFSGIYDDGDSSKPLMVDLRGFEPLTSSMRTRRATNCATGPETSTTLSRRAACLEPERTRRSGLRRRIPTRAYRRLSLTGRGELRRRPRAARAADARGPRSRCRRRIPSTRMAKPEPRRPRGVPSRSG